MYWAGLLQVGSVWEQRVAAQNFGPSLEREVCRSSELFVLDPSLKPGFGRSSESWVLCLVDRARSLALEHASASHFDLRAMFLGSSELFFARASEVYVLSFLARASIMSLEHASRLQTWSFELCARARCLLSDHFFARVSLAYIRSQQQFSSSLFDLFLSSNPWSITLSLYTLLLSTNTPCSSGSLP